MFLHEHPEFPELIRIVATEKNIIPQLIEKDYWIMHCLYGLTQQGFDFELKGGTSLSKGYGIIHRFSEDIDIRINPACCDSLDVKTGKNHDKPAHIQSRKDFYDWLAENIKIPGITEVSRDPAFDEEKKYRSGGIRLSYKSHLDSVAGVKQGILLELGFDDTTPNEPLTISSWAYDKATTVNLDLEDNRAADIRCYHPGYTFVEKLQAISTKFRKQQESSGQFPENFLRHYYDVYCLLTNDKVLEFIQSDDYPKRKNERFPNADNQIIVENEAFLLSDPNIRKLYDNEYLTSASLYYQDQPALDEILNKIAENIQQL